MQARIDVLRDKLSRAVLIDASQMPKGEVAFGSTVRVKDLVFDDEEEFTLVGAGEEDYDTGKILITSPLAQGLVGKKVGDRVEIDVPQGTLKFEILEIRRRWLRRACDRRCRHSYVSARKVQTGTKPRGPHPQPLSQKETAEALHQSGIFSGL